MNINDFDFTKLLDWGVLAWAARYLSSISKGIEKLNLQVAQLLERTEFHQKELDNHEKRISHIERRK